MFGIPAYAATPFAALAGTNFSFAVTEDISAADSSTQLSAFLQTITENTVVDEVENDVGGNFFAGLTEGIAFDDSSTQLSTFLQTFSDGVTQADDIAIAAQFAVALSEDTTVESAQELYFAFFDSITEDMTMADAETIIRVFTDSITEAITMADSYSAPANFKPSISESVIMADNTAVSGWAKIIDVQTPGWTTINNSQ